MSDEYRVVVTGGRDFTDQQSADIVLDALREACGVTLIVHGACGAPGEYRGADRCADEWAKSRGIPVEPVPAEWPTFGKSAGPRRNSKMLRDFEPHVVVAFPGGTGTADCVAKAERAGIPVIRFTPKAAEPKAV